MRQCMLRRAGGFTLTEMVVVVGIVGMLFSMGVAGFQSLLKSSSLDTPAQSLALLHRTLSREARLASRSGRVLGYTLSYSGVVNTQPAAMMATPWYIDYAKSTGSAVSDRTIFSSVGSMLAATSAELPIASSGAPSIDLSGVMAPSQSSNAAARNGVWLNQVLQSISGSTKVHVFLEPGTGFSYVFINTSDNPIQAGVNDKLDRLRSSKPDDLKIGLYRSGNATYPIRVVYISQLGYAEVGAP